MLKYQRANVASACFSPRWVRALLLALRASWHSGSPLALRLLPASGRVPDKSNKPWYKSRGHTDWCSNMKLPARVSPSRAKSPWDMALLHVLFSIPKPGKLPNGSIVTIPPAAIEAAKPFWRGPPSLLLDRCWGGIDLFINISSGFTHGREQRASVCLCIGEASAGPTSELLRAHFCLVSYLSVAVVSTSCTGS